MRTPPPPILRFALAGLGLRPFLFPSFSWLTIRKEKQDLRLRKSVLGSARKLTVVRTTGHAHPQIPGARAQSRCSLSVSLALVAETLTTAGYLTRPLPSGAPPPADKRSPAHFCMATRPPTLGLAYFRQVTAFTAVVPQSAGVRRSE